MTEKAKQMCWRLRPTDRHLSLHVLVNSSWTHWAAAGMGLPRGDHLHSDGWFAYLVLRDRGWEIIPDPSKSSQKRLQADTEQAAAQHSRHAIALAEIAYEGGGE